MNKEVYEIMLEELRRLSKINNIESDIEKLNKNILVMCEITKIIKD